MGRRSALPGVMENGPNMLTRSGGDSRPSAARGKTMDHYGERHAVFASGGTTKLRPGTYHYDRAWTSGACRSSDT